MNATKGFHVSEYEGLIMCFDSEPPKFFESRMVMARKEHLCCECDVVIGRGEKYESASGRWSFGCETFATCGRCVELRERIANFERSMGCHGSEAYPPFGELWEAVREMESYA